MRAETFTFDTEPSIDYRQHDSNDLGADLSTMRAIGRSYRHLGGLFRQWTDTHVAALNKHREVLTPENRRILDQFATARKAWLPARIIGLIRSGISRQSLAGNIKTGYCYFVGKNIVPRPALRLGGRVGDWATRRLAG